MEHEQTTAETGNKLLDPEGQSRLVRQLLNRQDEVLQQLDELDARVLQAIQQSVSSRSDNLEPSAKAA